jgi:ParB family transcriptional regulator, chromosome partitioning protein
MNMPLPKSRLGRGLASLIGEPAMAQPRLPNEGQQRVVALDQVHPSPLNPRKAFDEKELDELANSIRHKGLVQPIIVRATAEGAFEIVAGERRWRACQKAGLHEIAVIVRELDDRTMMEMAIIENVQRADLNPIEEAAGYNELIQRYQYTQDELAEQIGKSRSHLANTLRLLKLPDDVQGTWRCGRSRPACRCARSRRSCSNSNARDRGRKGRARATKTRTRSRSRRSFPTRSA